MRWLLAEDSGLLEGVGTVAAADVGCSESADAKAVAVANLAQKRCGKDFRVHMSAHREISNNSVTGSAGAVIPSRSQRLLQP